MERFCAVEYREHSPLRIGIIGNLTPVKAHEVFLEMAALLTGEGVDAEYWLVGRDKGYEATLRAIVAEHNLESRVKFLGFQEDIPSILAELDLSICCSHEETFGRCVVEAMAARLPVVATRVGGLPEVVEEGVTGLLVPPRDPAALAAAVKQLLDDQPMRERLGIAGRNRAVSMFGSPAHAREVLRIYSRYSTAARERADAANQSQAAPHSRLVESLAS
jgi:glycosyltransferase involved in cell wall biosynthesis